MLAYLIIHLSWTVFILSYQIPILLYCACILFYCALILSHCVWILSYPLICKVLNEQRHFRIFVLHSIYVFIANKLCNGWNNNCYILIRFTEIPTIAPYMSYVRVFPAQILTYIRWNIFSIVIEAHVNGKFCRVYWNDLTSTIG